MAIQNYWLNKGELEEKAVKVISEHLDWCIAAKTRFPTPQSIQDEIGKKVTANVAASHLGFYKVLFDVEIKADIVVSETDSIKIRLYVVTSYQNVTVEML